MRSPQHSPAPMSFSSSQRRPFGAHPRSRAIFVDGPLSSMKIRLGQRESSHSGPCCCLLATEAETQRWHRTASFDDFVGRFRETTNSVALETLQQNETFSSGT